MFFRKKRTGDKLYVQLVANEWREGRTRQRLLASLGNLDELVRSGELERLLLSGLRLLNLPSAGKEPPNPEALAGRGSPSLVVEPLWVEADCERALSALERPLGDEERRMALQCAVRLTAGLPIAPTNPAVAELFRVEGLSEVDLLATLSALAAIGRAARQSAGIALPPSSRRTPGPRVLLPEGVRPDSHETLYVIHERWPEAVSGRTPGYFAAMVSDRLARPDRLLIAEDDTTDALADLIARASARGPVRVIVRLDGRDRDVHETVTERRLATLLASRAPYAAVLDDAPRRLVESAELIGNLRIVRSTDTEDTLARQHAFHLLAGELTYPPALWIDAVPSASLPPGPPPPWEDVVMGDLVCRFLHLAVAVELQHRLFARHKRRVSPLEARAIVQSLESDPERAFEDPRLLSLLEVLGFQAVPRA